MKSPIRRLAPLMIIALFLVGVLNAARLSCAVSQETQRGAVTHVYDGDTIEVRGKGKVRLIGVDTLDGHNEEKMWEQARRLGLSPQSVKTWAQKATEFVRERVLDKEVRLEPGPEARGDYGRLLAYVSYASDGAKKNLNKLLLEKGLAVAYRKYKHPRRDQFVRLERAARKNREGLWQEASYR